jgi:hypothetical protein
MGLKGFEALTIAIIGLIVVISLFLLPFITLVTFRYHIIALAKLSYEYNIADIVLLELLEHNKNYQYLAEMDLPSFEKYVMPKNSFVENLNNTLKLLTLSNCSKLYSNSNIIVSSGNCEVKNVTWVEIFVPYNPKSLVKKLSLGVG